VAFVCTERDLGSNNNDYLDLPRISLRTTVEHRSAFFSRTNDSPFTT
jgi:hypothetical protein